MDDCKIVLYRTISVYALRTTIFKEKAGLSCFFDNKGILMTKNKTVKARKTHAQRHRFDYPSLYLPGN